MELNMKTDSMTIDNKELNNVEATTRTMSGLISLEKVEQMLYKIKNLYWRSMAAVIAVYNFKKGNRKEEEINILRNYILFLYSTY
jgi:hypothetical protein